MTICNVKTVSCDEPTETLQFGSCSFFQLIVLVLQPANLLVLTQATQQKSPDKPTTHYRRQS